MYVFKSYTANSLTNDLTLNRLHKSEGDMIRLLTSVAAKKLPPATKEPPMK